jgi:glycine cleavage system H lipoate-binding protein
MEKTRFDNHLDDKDAKPAGCVWMQAKVVRRKYCKDDFHCRACVFDRALSSVAHKNKILKAKGKTPSGKRGKIVFWKDKLNELPPSKRPCAHSMKGRIELRACTNEYRCGNCEFDQFFYDQYSVHAVVKPVDAFDIDGFKIPQGFYLHKGHAWVKIEDDSYVRVGIDDFALRIMGPFDQIKTPLMGKTVNQGDPDITLTRGRNNATVLSPVTGVVTSINSDLREHGSMANSNPYSQGWVLRIHSENLRNDLKNLMIADETKKFFKHEVDRLYEVVEEVAPLATDGGYIGNDLYGNMPQIGWNRLRNLFLRT